MKKSASKLNLLKRAFELGANNIWRNKLLSIATIFVMGIIIFIFNIILAVNFIAQDALTDLSKKVDVIVYLKDSTNYAQSEEIAADIRELEGVENVIYTSKNDALNQIKSSHPSLSLAFEKYKLGNPLPASLNVSTSHPKYHQGIINFLSQDRYQALLSNFSANSGENNDIISGVSKNLLTVTNFTQQVIFWLITIFIIGGALVILNALQITIFSRKKEIEVMKLVGASYWFIRLPFIIESIIYGILAILLSFIMILII